MKPIILDANGHIEVNDSMSDELKEKIAQYNAYADINPDGVDDEEISEEEVESLSASSFDDLEEYSSDDVESLEPEEEVESSVSDEDLNNLNDLFS